MLIVAQELNWLDFQAGYTLPWESGTVELG